MKNKRLYQILILLLLILNLGTLGFIWFHKSNKDKQAGPAKASEFIIKELGLSDSQQKEYILLREEHRESMKRLSKNDKTLHNHFFDMIFKETQDSASIQFLADSISANRKKMEIVTYDHFFRINKMLNSEQQKKFTSIFREVLRLVLPPLQPPPPPGGPPPPPPPPPPEQE